MILRPVRNDGELVGYSFRCPGCESDNPLRVGRHVFWIAGTIVWTFNGSPEAPTFAPSLVNRWNEPSAPKVCHIYMTNGRIEYLGDCTHALAGQTVAMVPFESES